MRKTEWWFKDSLSEEGQSYWVMQIDEESSESEIEDEIEYWMEQYDGLEGSDAGKAIMQMIAWMTKLLGAF